MQQVKRLINNFVPENYQLSLKLDRLERAFSGEVRISGELPANQKSLSLHAKGLSISETTVNQVNCSYALGDHDELRIDLPDDLPKKLTIQIQYSGQITDAMHGLYPCYYELAGVKQEILATQFESHHAREVFPCIDEPEAKATFDLTLDTEPSVTVLSNMPIKGQQSIDNRLSTSFQQTPRMSTYLLAFVVGDLQKSSQKTARGVGVNVYATKVHSAESLEFALNHAVKTIEFFEEYFDVPYPLPKSDQVALPDFSSGAMENWGLITYRETALLADPKQTPLSAKRYIATVISHELSHMWFGNLVTMKWWNNLWLNESFATLMEYIAVDAIQPTWKAWLEFASNESVLALRRDASDGVQPVQVEVSHPDEISTIFDGAIVYAKGARLMRMLQEYIGEQAFKNGLTSYFHEFAYENTSAEDLWRHLSKASQKDISNLMNSWISTNGYPVVTVDENQISQTQFFIGPHQPSDRIWPIPLESSALNFPELLSEKTLDAKLPIGERLNIKDSAHFITNYDEVHLTKLLENLPSVDELGRMQLLNEQTLLVRGDLAPSVRLIELLKAYQSEASNFVWDMMGLAFSELKKFVEDDELAEAKLKLFAYNLAKPQFDRLGWENVPNEVDSDTELRSTILGMMIYSEDEAILEKVDSLFALGLDEIDPEIRPLIIGSAVKRTPDLNLIKTIFKNYTEATSVHLKDDICAGLTNAKNQDHIDYLLSQLTDKQAVRAQDIYRWFAYLIRSRYAKRQTWRWMVENWSWIEENFDGDKGYDYFPRYAVAGISDRQSFSDYQKFFGPLKSNPSLKRAIEVGETEIIARLDLLDRDGEAVRAALYEL